MGPAFSPLAPSWKKKRKGKEKQSNGPVYSFVPHELFVSTDSKSWT